MGADVNFLTRGDDDEVECDVMECLQRMMTRLLEHGIQITAEEYMCFVDTVGDLVDSGADIIDAIDTLTSATLDALAEGTEQPNGSVSERQALVGRATEHIVEACRQDDDLTNQLEDRDAIDFLKDEMCPKKPAWPPDDTGQPPGSVSERQASIEAWRQDGYRSGAALPSRDRDANQTGRNIHGCTHCGNNAASMVRSRDGNAARNILYKAWIQLGLPLPAAFSSTEQALRPANLGPAPNWVRGVVVAAA